MIASSVLFGCGYGYDVFLPQSYARQIPWSSVEAAESGFEISAPNLFSPESHGCGKANVLS